MRALCVRFCVSLCCRMKQSNSTIFSSPFFGHTFVNMENDGQDIMLLLHTLSLSVVVDNKENK